MSMSDGEVIVFWSSIADGGRRVTVKLNGVMPVVRCICLL